MDLDPGHLFKQRLLPLLNNEENGVSGLEAFCFRPKQFFGNCSGNVRNVRKTVSAGKHQRGAAIGVASEGEPGGLEGFG